MDHSGWYDRKELTIRKLVDVHFVAAMGPPGGGRNTVTNRYLRHYSVISLTAFDSDNLRYMRPKAKSLRPYRPSTLLRSLLASLGADLGSLSCLAVICRSLTGPVFLCPFPPHISPALPFSVPSPSSTQHHLHDAGGLVAEEVQLSCWRRVAAGPAAGGCLVGRVRLSAERAAAHPR